jgi:hypothetical protein
MRYLLILLIITGCESPVIQKDHRQIVAKTQILRILPDNAMDFDVTGFREDTLSSWTDSLIKKPIRYSLDFEYRDSTGLKKKTGDVYFTSDGKSVIRSEIRERNQ